MPCQMLTFPRKDGSESIFCAKSEERFLLTGRPCSRMFSFMDRILRISFTAAMTQTVREYADKT